MGILKRIKSITMAEINKLLDQVEDPINMLSQYMREMEEEIAKGQHALANQIFLEKRQLALIIDTEEVLAKRERQAKLAVTKGEDNIAALALQEKLLQEKKRGLYKEQYEVIKGQTNLLEEKINQLKEQYNELQHKRLLLLSRANVAQSLKQLDNAVVSLNTDNIARGFARAEERIVMMESKIEANTRLSNISPSSSYAIDPSLQEEVQKQLAQLRETAKETSV
ncbi:phage shock protein A (PspA) family protein [Aneurinibacillus soli]|uniref:Uncharacterized protein n=1 Tax=Aneurinibacillus soli TaxID=1500254 RepID=A0A0U5B1Q0_9BACL|nr:PspA/IM30 family protein [Aneurinibacillus soli]PYE61628.1 phage shock protein A (PspA) family protein [Aneurinibacillus soli]BAU28514.1 hypothetical protein CB4_02688 [Aneurinibacillus soli]